MTSCAMNVPVRILSLFDFMQFEQLLNLLSTEFASNWFLYGICDIFCAKFQPRTNVSFCFCRWRHFVSVALARVSCTCKVADNSYNYELQESGFKFYCCLALTFISVLLFFSAKWFPFGEKNGLSIILCRSELSVLEVVCINYARQYLRIAYGWNSVIFIHSVSLNRDSFDLLVITLTDVVQFSSRHSHMHCNFIKIRLHLETL